MITHYHTSESILCTYATTEHSPIEHYRTEHSNTEHYTTEHYKTEHYTTDRYTTEHYTMEQYTTGDYTTEHHATDQYNTTEQNTNPEHRETLDLRITCPRENIPKAKANRQKRTGANRRRQRRFSPYGYGRRGHKATRIIKTHVKSSTQGHAVFEKIRKYKRTVDKRNAPQRRRANRFAPYARKVF